MFYHDPLNHRESIARCPADVPDVRDAFPVMVSHVSVFFIVPPRTRQIVLLVSYTVERSARHPFVAQRTSQSVARMPNVIAAYRRILLRTIERESASFYPAFGWPRLFLIRRLLRDALAFGLALSVEGALDMRIESFFSASGSYGTVLVPAEQRRFVLDDLPT